MNEYQKALQNVQKCNCNDCTCEDIEILKELIEENQELEESLEHTLEKWKEWKNKAMKLEKALDKACMILEEAVEYHKYCTNYDSLVYNSLTCSCKVYFKTKEAWKEWCMKDE